MTREYNNEKREVMVSHQSDLLTQDLILTGIYKHCKFTDYGLSFDFPAIRYEHGSGDISYPTWQVEELKNLELQESDLIKLVTFLEEELGDYKKYLEDFETQIKSDDERIAKVQKYFTRTFRGVSTIPYFAFEMALYKQLEKDGFLPKDISSSTTDTALASVKIAEIARSYDEEIVQHKNSHAPLTISEPLKAELKSFCGRFGYLGMIYFKGNPWTIPEAFRMLLAPESNKKKKQNKSQSTPHAKIASDLLKLRTQKWELMCYGTSLLRKFIKSFFVDEIVYEELLNLRVDEVLELVEAKYPLENKGQGRDFFVLEIKNDGVRLSLNSGPAKEKYESQQGEVRGITASPGKVIGRVKVILSPREGFKFKDGDILVTKMSTPDFLPIMKKAAAFVTDIGGITSHAAIVSREMGKPCLIGTKIATQVLKDGMMVEVDAERGIVQIIERAKSRTETGAGADKGIVKILK